MAKFCKFPKLSKRATQNMVVDLCNAIAVTKNNREAAELLTDLLGKQELEMIAKRLKVAELLLEGCTYEDIKTELKVSPSTIARVHVWLQTSGEGYRLIIERTKSRRKIREQNEQPFKLKGLKRKYPLYYWPQIMLEYWVKNATQKEKGEMQKILDRIEIKSQTYKEFANLLR